MSSSSFCITLVSNDRSELLPLDPASTKISDLLGYAQALFGVGDDCAIHHKGIPLLNLETTLQQAGIGNGELLLVQPVTTSTSASSSGNNAPTGGGGLDFSNLLASTTPATTQTSTTPVYYPGMSLEEAMHVNPHPTAIVTLLRQHDVLFRQLNYHNPVLGNKLQHQNTLEGAIAVWKEHLVRGGIQGALHATTAYHQDRQMQQRLDHNPNDTQAQDYFRKQRLQKVVQEQYRTAMEEYPESMGRVLMLYIKAKINGHEIQAFVDSGAQTTIMSKTIAQQCGLLDYVDTRFAGVAVGVGTGKILGRCHLVQLEIEGTFFPCSVTIMDNPNHSAAATSAPNKTGEMEFLLGLDMLKRHTCLMDLQQGVLKFRLAPGQFLETPFLHEKDLSEAKGGTKGFDANKANQELLRLQQQEDEQDNKKKTDKDDDDKKPSADMDTSSS